MLTCINCYRLSELFARLIHVRKHLDSSVLMTYFIGQDSLLFDINIFESITSFGFLTYGKNLLNSWMNNELSIIL